MRILGNQLLHEVHSPFQISEMERSVHPAVAGLARLFADLVAWQRNLARYGRLRRAASELARLDDRMLADIGISRVDIGAAVAGIPLREQALLVQARQD
jgi:uncharacterized protein YjiS (DUF1127 family)